MEKHVPEWMLERYLLDELPQKKRRQIENDLARDPALRAELEKLRASDREILGAYPAEQMLPGILKKATPAKPEPVPPHRLRLAWAAAPAAALIIFLAVILPLLMQRRRAVPENSRSEDYVGIKGGEPLSLSAPPALQIFRKGNGAERILRDGEVAMAGDLLQLAYIPRGQTHGVILSIDGWGSATLHFPEKTNSSTALANGRRVFLASSYELDRAPRFERFFFITAMDPLPTAAIMEKAMALAAAHDQAMSGRLDLPRRFGQYSLLVRK
jgi:hypothetical protein